MSENIINMNMGKALSVKEPACHEPKIVLSGTEIVGRLELTSTQDDEQQRDPCAPVMRLTDELN